MRFLNRLPNGPRIIRQTGLCLLTPKLRSLKELFLTFKKIGAAASRSAMHGRKEN